MTREDVSEWAEDHDLRKDKWGHHKTADEKFRFRMLKTKVRCEVRVNCIGKDNRIVGCEWLLIWSEFYSRLTPERIEGLLGTISIQRFRIHPEIEEILKPIIERLL